MMDNGSSEQFPQTPQTPFREYVKRNLGSQYQVGERLRANFPAEIRVDDDNLFVAQRAIHDDFTSVVRSYFISGGNGEFYKTQQLTISTKKGVEGFSGFNITRYPEGPNTGNMVLTDDAQDELSYIRGKQLSHRVHEGTTQRGDRLHFFVSYYDYRSSKGKLDDAAISTATQLLLNSKFGYLLERIQQDKAVGDHLSVEMIHGNGKGVVRAVLSPEIHVPYHIIEFPSELDVDDIINEVISKEFLEDPYALPPDADEWKVRDIRKLMGIHLDEK